MAFLYNTVAIYWQNQRYEKQQSVINNKSSVMKITGYIYMYRVSFLFCLFFYIYNVQAQSPITSIGISNSNVPVLTESNIKGAGYSFSVWKDSGSFTINYGSSAANDINSITTFTTGGNTYIPITAPSAQLKVRRAPNATINNQRAFMTSWKKCSSYPPNGSISGTFNIESPKVGTMEEAMATNSINFGYDNVFNNLATSPHYGNVERLDYIVPAGFVATNSPNKAGFAVFDRGVGDDFKIAAITSVDASGNPTGYKVLRTVLIANFSSTGLLMSNFEYVIFVSDPDVAGGESRPSTRGSQNIKGVYISMQDLGIAIDERIYGYSLFGSDVDPALGHILTDPSTFPTNSNFGGGLDPLNVFTMFESGIIILPVKLDAFSGIYKKSTKTVDLKWNTSSEQGLKLFNVEKSNNGEDWESLTQINASGNIQGSNYFYTDYALQNDPRLYYRLKMTNDDASFQYSDIVIFRQPQPNDITIAISKNSMFIKTEINVKEARLFDMKGNLVMTKKVKGRNANIEILLNSIPSGVYVALLIDQNNITYSKQFVNFN